MMRSIESSVALVTGAAQGIGKAIAARLVTDGHDIALNDIGANADKLEATAEELRASGRRVITVIADVSKPQDVTDMVTQGA